MLERSGLMVELERACQMYWDGACLRHVMTWGYEHWPIDRALRYASTSRPAPHEFDGSDAKAVFRRLRHGRPVSHRLIQRAADALWKEAYQFGRDSSDEDD
jgi:hypothetical protein